MNVVDSSAWLEYFVDGPNAAYFAKAIEDLDNLLVPSITIYEVFKKVLLERGEELALQVVAQMKLGRLIALNDDLAINAARLSSDHKLPMADSVILASAQEYDAWVWTQDDHFKGLPKVNFRGKK